MATVPYRFPAPQAAFLRALETGAYHPVVRGGRETSLVDRMPPIYQQALQGTCVANAVTALLEYYGDCRTRLSVQFLHAATKEVERAGLERNLKNLRAGEALDPGFESVFHVELQQLRLLADANGGIDTPAVRPYLSRFVDGVRSRFARSPGSLLMSCFRAVEAYGVCRYALWPYASAQATPIFGDGTGTVDFPPGTREDAAKRRIVHGLYLLGTPNNVDEIRGILDGANGRRAMPVVVTVDFFAGCDGRTYSFPETEADVEGRLVSKNAWLGRHGLLIVGYTDDASVPGGGFFIIRNSLGETWGDRGYGRLPYAYLECFALEAGTIFQDRIDYEGDGYGGQRAVPVPEKARRSSRMRNLLLNLLLAAGLVAVTIAVGVVFDDPFGFRRKPRQETPVPSAPVAPAKPKPALVPEGGLTGYKVFLSCTDAAERKALREALASEGVPFAVEFMPQTLETVLAVRVTMPEGNAYEAFANVLKDHYAGPRREFWTDVAGLSRSRAIYIVKATVRKWESGQ